MSVKLEPVSIEPVVPLTQRPPARRRTGRTAVGFLGALCFLLAIALAATIVIATHPARTIRGTAVAAHVPAPAAPAPVGPADGAVFSHYPRTTTLSWTAVPGAVSYTVELQIQTSDDSPWYPDDPDGPRINNIADTTYNFSFVGAQPGRWRVFAVDAQGSTSAPSPWSTFEYTV